MGRRKEEAIALVFREPRHKLAVAFPGGELRLARARCERETYPTIPHGLARPGQALDDCRIDCGSFVELVSRFLEFAWLKLCCGRGAQPRDGRQVLFPANREPAFGRRRGHDSFRPVGQHHAPGPLRRIAQARRERQHPGSVFLFGPRRNTEDSDPRRNPFNRLPGLGEVAVLHQSLDLSKLGISDENWELVNPSAAGSRPHDLDGRLQQGDSLGRPAFALRGDAEKGVGHGAAKEQFAVGGLLSQPGLDLRQAIPGDPGHFRPVA